MVILQVVMFPSRSVAMPTFSSQISKLFLPFGRLQPEPAVAWAEDTFRAKRNLLAET